MSNNTLDQNILRQVLFILLIIGLGLLLFYELSFFIPAVLGSLTLYILMRKRMHYLTEVRKWSGPKAAWLLMILSFLVILLPIGILVNLLTSKIVYAVEHSSQILDSLKRFSEEMRQRFGFAIADDATINQIGPFIRKIIPQILSITVNTISIIGVLYFVLYFMLIYSRVMEDKLYEYIPLRDSNVDHGSAGSFSLVRYHLCHCYAPGCRCRVSICPTDHNIFCTGKKRARAHHAYLWLWGDWPCRQPVSFYPQ